MGLTVFVTESYLNLRSLVSAQVPLFAPNARAIRKIDIAKIMGNSTFSSSMCVNSVSTTLINHVSESHFLFVGSVLRSFL